LNLTKLIKAAKEISRLRTAQAIRTTALQQLATDRRNGLSKQEGLIRLSRIDSTGVVDFSTAIDELCEALSDDNKED
jgi:hypothetical protein